MKNILDFLKIQIKKHDEKRPMNKQNFSQPKSGLKCSAFNTDSLEKNYTSKIIYNMYNINTNK